MKKSPSKGSRQSRAHPQEHPAEKAVCNATERSGTAGIWEGYIRTPPFAGSVLTGFDNSSCNSRVCNDVCVENEKSLHLSRHQETRQRRLNMPDKVLVILPTVLYASYQAECSKNAGWSCCVRISRPGMSLRGPLPGDIGTRGGHGERQETAPKSAVEGRESERDSACDQMRRTAQQKEGKKQNHDMCIVTQLHLFVFGEPSTGHRVGMW